MADVFRPLSMNVKRLFSLRRKRKKKKNGGWWENDLIFSLNTQIFFLFVSLYGRPPHHNIEEGWNDGGGGGCWFFGLCLKGPETQIGPLYRVDFLSLVQTVLMFFSIFFFSLSPCRL